MDVMLLRDVMPAAAFDSAQVDLGVWITTPSGRRYRQPAFYDPESRTGWRIRWLPEQSGWHTLEVVLGRRRGPARMMHVEARPDAHAGAVRVHPRNAAMLASAGGATFVPIGANIAWFTRDALAEYERRFDALAAAGGNVTRIWLAPWSFAVEWQDTPLGDYRARLSRAREFDQVLRMAEARRIRVIVVLLEPGMFNRAERWEANPYNAANGGPCATPSDFLSNAQARAAYRNQLRYIAARWGYSPSILAWEFMNEVNSAVGFETPLLLPWLREMSAALRAADPQQHLHTISYASVAGDPQIWALPEIDLVQRHEYAQGDPLWFRTLRDSSGRAIRPVQVREQPRKPLLIAEFGANSTSELPRGAYREGIQLHNGLWAAVFAGTAGGAMYWWWDSYLEDGNLWWRHSGLARFVSDVDLARYEPALADADAGNAVPVSAMALFSPGDDAALLWVRNTLYSHDAALSRALLAESAGEPFVFSPRPATQVQVRVVALPPGRYRVTRVNTRTGAEFETAMLQADATGLVLTISELRHDSAYKIRRHSR
jgi:hypothetical protein